MLLHPRPPHSLRLHRRRDLVPPHKRPSTPLRDHRLPLVHLNLGNGTRVLDRLPNEKQRRSARPLPRDLQKRQRLPLHARPDSGPRTSCGLSSGCVDRAVRPFVLILPPLGLRIPITDVSTHSYAIYASLGIFVYHREHSSAKQRKWIGAQKRTSLLKRRSEDEEEAAAKKKEELEKEATPMLESRASLAQEARGKTVTWE